MDQLNLKIKNSIQLFLNWYQDQGLESFDPYDLSAGCFGVFSRKLYYRNKYLGMPFVGMLMAMDIFCPQLRLLVSKKKVHPAALAQLILGYLNLFEISKESRCLEKAVEISESLLAVAVPGFSGYCWGYPFDWQNNRGLWKKNTPFITAVPYCFEAFVKLFEITGDSKYDTIARSIAQFVYKDIKDTQLSETHWASSYSPEDDSLVINASAYRAFVVFESGRRFNDKTYQKKALGYIQFVVQSQREDGAWLYALNNPQDAFIDHFHTCFVLKNLIKINRYLQSFEVERTIEKGYQFYRQNLFDEKNLPKPFAKKIRLQLVRYELYDFAESISLGVLLKEKIPEAYRLSLALVETLINRYQPIRGFFATRVYRFGLQHRFPFLRWPQAQLFYALTNVLKSFGSLKEDKKKNAQRFSLS